MGGGTAAAAPITRRALLAGAAALGLTGGALLPIRPVHATPLPGEHAQLADLARTLAAAPHRSTKMTLAPPFAGLDYDSHRGIRPRPGAAAGLPLGPDFRADLLPPGFLFDDRVTVTLVDPAGQPRQMRFAPDLFSFAPERFGAPPPTMPAEAAARMGFAGLRLRHPLNRDGIWDELAVFQGASYFRALGKGDVYGLSARGFALGTGDGGEPEEFPVFSRLRAAQTGPDTARLAALMESPALTGAFTMDIRPGAPTVMDVHASLFPRRDIAQGGIAPLTSMYYFGPMRRGRADDFRPRVHDSDALIMRNGAGERLWRPLANPAAVQVSAFADDGPRGFGLVQSSRRFEDYLDAEAAYHRRPSAWVEPLDDWGRGAVTLVEIPTANEFNDNIVAFWRPEAPMRAGERLDFRYRLHWGAPSMRPSRMPVRRAMSGRSARDPRALTFVVDFNGQEAGARPELRVDGADTRGLTRYPLPQEDTTRVSFELVPGDADAAELRLSLHDADGLALSDIWVYRWTGGHEGAR